VKRILILLAVLLLGLSLSYPIVTYFNSTKSQGQSQAPSASSAQSSTDATNIKYWKSAEDFDRNLAVFETVFWDPRDTKSLRNLIREDGLTADKEVLEIGTGSGLLALCCLKAGAKKVVATDVNPSAIANAIFNAEQLDFADRLVVRLVPLEDSSAFSVIAPEEKFDLIISNPPWVNQQPKTIDEYALYDANFALMKSLFDGLRDHLKPGGRVLLAYGCVDAINTMEKLANEREFGFIIRDTRNLDDLPEEFLPGMLVEIQVPEE
jgi:release factor glutamine methyltransferase